MQSCIGASGILIAFISANEIDEMTKLSIDSIKEMENLILKNS